MSLSEGLATRKRWQRVLVVGHSDQLDLTIRRVLAGDAYRVDVCDTPADAEIRCSHEPPDALVLLSEWPNFTRNFIANLRQFSRVPIMVVCELGAEPPSLILEAGADDVVPFGVTVDELTARVKALVRRAKGTFGRGGVQILGEGIHLHLGRQQLSIGERELSLTTREFRFMLALAADRGNTVTNGDLAEAVWGTRLYGEDAIRALVKRLRTKLGDARGLLKAHYGVGYYLDCAHVLEAATVTA